MTADSASLELRVDSIEQQEAVRYAIGDWFDGCDLGSLSLYEITLIVTELLTNAFEHGDARHVDVCLRSEDDRVIMGVTQPATEEFEIDPVMPGVGSPRSRGLAIVAHLADDLTAEHTAEALTMKATITLDGTAEGTLDGC